MRFILLIGSILSLIQIPCSVKSQSSIITIGLESRHANVDKITTCKPSTFTKVLETALASIPDGGIINVLDGTYHLNQTIKLRSKQSIIGQGSETNLLLSENFTAFQIEANDKTKAEDISIQHLKITVNNQRYNQNIFHFKAGNGTETFIQNNRISNLNIDYVNSVDRIKLIQLLSNKSAFIRDNTIADIEISFAKANHIELIDLLSNGKIKNNDFSHINLLKIGAYNDAMTPGYGLRLVTGKPKASLLNNSFSNLRFPPLEKGIYVSLGSNETSSGAKDSWINNNRFTDLYFEGYKVGISFNKMNDVELYSFNHNMFRDIILQTKAYSVVGIDNIFGKGNSFLYCHVYDWHKKNKSTGTHIIRVSKNARYTYINNPRIFIDFVEDKGNKTTWICNGTNSQFQQNSSINKTSQLFLFDNTNGDSPIKSERHIAKINSLKQAEGNSLQFYTLDPNNEFSKKLVIDQQGNTIIKNQLTIEDLPSFTDGQMLVAKSNTVGRINNKQLKENLGIAAVENQINDIELNQKETLQNLEERLVILEAYIHQLEQQINAQ